MKGFTRTRLLAAMIVAMLSLVLVPASEARPLQKVKAITAAAAKARPLKKAKATIGRAVRFMLGDR